MVGEVNACGDAFSHLSRRDLAPAYPAQRISNLSKWHGFSHRQFWYQVPVLSRRNPLKASPFAAIGIGETVTRLPLPHHRRCGSAYGGSEGYASPFNSRGRPSRSEERRV